MRVDLHCHSTASDGVLAPAALVQRAHEKGVGLLALFPLGVATLRLRQPEAEEPEPPMPVELTASAADRLAARKVTRELRRKSAGGQLAALTDEAARWLEAAWLLRREGGVDLAGALGQSRRNYAQEGSLRLWGVASEAVLSRAGYAGVVTLLCDDEGRGS